MPKFKKENPITEEMIYKDPFNYTLKDISPILGEKKANSFYKSIYRARNFKPYKTIKIVDIFNGGDTRKYAFKLNDGYCIETVCIKRKTGTTICVSTMVGCPVGCYFCESGSNGFVRNLTASEIVQQVLLVKERVNRIVFMGMGEPLLNYDNLIKSILNTHKPQVSEN